MRERLCAASRVNPFDKLRDVLGAFFDEERDGLGAAEAVARVDGVLLVQADLVFVAQGNRDSALRPGRRGITQKRLRQDKHAAGVA